MRSLEELRVEEVEVLRVLGFGLFVTSSYEYLQSFISLLCEKCPTLVGETLAKSAALGILHVDEDFLASLCPPLEKAVAVLNCVLEDFLSNDSSKEGSLMRKNHSSDAVDKDGIINAWRSLAEDCGFVLHSQSINSVEAIVLAGFLGDTAQSVAILQETLTMSSALMSPGRESPLDVKLELLVSPCSRDLREHVAPSSMPFVNDSGVLEVCPVIQRKRPPAGYSDGGREGIKQARRSLLPISLHLVIEDSE